MFHFPDPFAYGGRPMYGSCAKLFPFAHNHAVMSLPKTGRWGNDFGILVINDLADGFDGGRRHDKKIRAVCWMVMSGFSGALFPQAAYLHHWLLATIHFNRYNLCFDKYTECRDKCKLLCFIFLHIRVVPLSFSLFVECSLSDSMCWMIRHFLMDVTEHLLNTNIKFWNFYIPKSV